MRKRKNVITDKREKKGKYITEKWERNKKSKKIYDN